MNQLMTEHQEWIVVAIVAALIIGGLFGYMIGTLDSSRNIRKGNGSRPPVRQPLPPSYATKPHLHDFSIEMKAGMRHCSVGGCNAIRTADGHVVLSRN